VSQTFNWDAGILPDDRRLSVIQIDIKFDKRCVYFRLILHNVVKNFHTKFGSWIEVTNGIKTIHESVWRSNVIGCCEDWLRKQETEDKTYNFFSDSIGDLLSDFTFFVFYSDLILFFFSLFESF
jgi:hypothetical protein